MDYFEENFQYLANTYRHRLAMKRLLDSTISAVYKFNSCIVADLNRNISKHDVDKMEYLLRMPKVEASALHRRFAGHHIQNGKLNGKGMAYKLEMMFDFECAGMTKKNKKLNCRDTIISKYPELLKDNEIMGALRLFGWDESYSYVDTMFEDVNKLLVTPEMILKHIENY